MLLIVAILFLIIVLLVLRKKNKNMSDTRNMKMINKIIYSVWFMFFILFMLNLGDENKYQLVFTLLLAGVTVLSIVILIVIQIIKLKINIK